MPRLFHLCMHSFFHDQKGKTRGLRNWLRDRAKPVENHQLSTSYSFLFEPTSVGRPVTERSAMQMMAVYSCVRILAETIAGLPLRVYRTESDRSKVKATDHRPVAAASSSAASRSRRVTPSAVFQ